MSSKTVVIGDSHQGFASSLRQGFLALGYEAVVVDEVHAALSLAKDLQADLIVSEQRLGSHNWLDLLMLLRDAQLVTRFAIVTAFGSITSAVLATKLGACAYLAKPVTPQDIIRAVEASPEDLTELEARPSYCSLERAKWEYINMTVSSAGSIAEAARRLRVERRSLRRMLAKYPPIR